MVHEHPIVIFRHAVKNVWLLIFPILRGIRTFSFDIETFYTWLKGAWFDLIIIFLILGFGLFRWLFTWCRFGRNHIRVTSGVFIKHRVSVPYKNISAITAKHSFYLRPFKASWLGIDTCAGMLGGENIKLIVRSRDLKIIEQRIPETRMKKGRSFQFRPKSSTLVFFSFVFSSSVSGVIYLATLLFHTGRVINGIMKKDLPDVVKIANNVSEDMSERVPLEIPPVIMILLFLLIGTWLFSFVSNILRYSGFVMKKNRDMLRVVSGAVTKRVYHIMPKKINYIDIRQNFLMKIFNISSIHINCSGYGKNKYEMPVLLPILTKEQTNHSLEILGFDKYVTSRKVKPEKLAFWSYINIPCCLAIGAVIAAYVTAHFFPQISHILTLAVILADIPLLWLIIVKMAAFATTGITMEDDFCCIRYSRFFAFHTILADKNKLVKVQIFQDVIDEKIGRCRLDFYFDSETAKANKVKGLNIKDAKKIIEKFNFHM